MKEFSCFKCPKLVESRSRIVFGKKYSNYDMFIVGEAPGKNEDILGIPFVGKSGQILKDSLNKNNLFEYYITNIVKCRPNNNRDPTALEISNCTPYLISEILEYKPKIILSLGRKSTESLYNLFNLDFTSISEVRGNFIKINFKNRSILLFSTYHPASTIFNKKFRNDFNNDIKKLSDITSI